MQTHPHNLWWFRATTFLLAALASASAAYWALKWSATVPAAPSAALMVASASPPDPQVIARLLGGGRSSSAAAPGAVPDSAASRFKLTGVVANRAKGGYALIAIDGKPAQPYRVGARIDDRWVLHSVAPRSAALAASADAPVTLTLELPPRKQP